MPGPDPSSSPDDPATDRRDPDAARDGGDPREWGAAAHVAIWSAAARNRYATTAGWYCALSLVPWLLLFGFGRRPEASLALVAFLLPVPLAGAAVSAMAYLRAAAPRYAGRGIATATLFAHGIHLSFLVLTLAYAGASEPGNRLACAGHLRQIGQSMVFYAVKYDAKFPPAFDELIVHADTKPQTFVCDSTGDRRAPGETLEQVVKAFRVGAGHNSYVYAAAGLSADAVTREHVLAYENWHNHGKGGMNVLFGDGNVRWLDREEAEHVVAEIKAGRNPPAPRRENRNTPDPVAAVD